jgi:TetR/AcrR family transcriptional repressor of nem operon
MGSKGALTRQEIIDASLQLFSVNGYFHTATSDILEATGLTKGGLYGHFASKEEIWEAAYERALEMWQQIVFDGVREIPQPIDRIVRTLENQLLDYIGGDVFKGGCFFLNELVELSGQAERMAERVLDGIRAYARLLTTWLTEARFAGLIRSDVDCEETAYFLLSVVNGAAAIYAAARDRAVLEGAVRHMRLHLESLGASDAAHASA